jgi:hypothetical protein
VTADLILKASSIITMGPAVRAPRRWRGHLDRLDRGGQHANQCQARTGVEPTDLGDTVLMPGFTKIGHPVLSGICTRSVIGLPQPGLLTYADVQELWRTLDPTPEGGRRVLRTGAPRSELQN